MEQCQLQQRGRSWRWSYWVKSERERRIPHDITHTETLNDDTNAPIYESETYSKHIGQTCGRQGERAGGGTEDTWAGATITHRMAKGKGLLWGTGDYAQYTTGSGAGEEYTKECRYTYIYTHIYIHIYTRVTDSLCCTQQKVTQHCKSTTFQFLKKVIAELGWD